MKLSRLIGFFKVKNIELLFLKIPILFKTLLNKNHGIACMYYNISGSTGMG